MQFKELDFVIEKPQHESKIITADHIALVNLVQPQQLDAALQWCRQQRRNWPAHDEIWAISLQWHDEKQNIIKALLSGQYNFNL